MFLFRALTSDAFIIKIVTELLEANLKSCHFEIDSESIKLVQMDDKSTTLFSVDLTASSFTEYEFNAKSKLFVGLSLNHFYMTLQTVKKKDIIELSISEESPKSLISSVWPQNNTHRTRDELKIQEFQRIDIDLPVGYDKGISIISSNFQKMLKSIIKLGSSIVVKSNSSKIQFLCNKSNIILRDIEFGDKNDNSKFTYSQDFDQKILLRLLKITGLSTSLEIFTKENLPLLITSPVGTLGKISIFVKSKQQIAEDSSSVGGD